MANLDEIQTRFNAGELSPNIDGLVDFEPFLMAVLLLKTLMFTLKVGYFVEKALNL